MVDVHYGSWTWDCIVIFKKGAKTYRRMEHYLHEDIFLGPTSLETNTGNYMSKYLKGQWRFKLAGWRRLYMNIIVHILLTDP